MPKSTRRWGCPFCGNTDQQGQNDLIPGLALISHFVLEHGKVVPEWSGETIVNWDGQAPDPATKRYHCRACYRDYNQPKEVTK